MSTHEQRNLKDIESEIEQTRSRLDNTITAIQDKFSTGQLVDQALDYVRRARHGGPAEFASNLGQTAKQNPVPVTLVGLGLSWLMISGPSHASESGTTTLPARRSDASSSGVGNAMSTAGTGAKRMASGSREKAGHVAHSAHEGFNRMKSGTRSSVSNVSRGAGKAGKQAAHLMQEQPLMVGALGLALGATLGALLYSTRIEDELMGEARDDVVDRATEVGEQQFEKAKSVAQSAKATALDEADKQDHAPERPEDRHRDVPEDTTQAGNEDGLNRVPPRSF